MFSDSLEKNVEALLTGVIGAILGVFLTSSASSFVTAFFFLIILLILGFLNALTAHLMNGKEDLRKWSVISFIVFLLFWVATIITFGHLAFWADDWSRSQVQKPYCFTLAVVFLTTILTLGIRTLRSTPPSA